MIGRVAQLSTYWQKLTESTVWVTSLEKARRMRILALRQYNIIEELLKYSGGIDLEHIISHQNVTFEIIARYPAVKWPWKVITTNPNITFEMLLELIEICKIPTDTVFIIGKDSAVTLHEINGSGRNLRAILHSSIATTEDYVNGLCLCNMKYFQMIGAITENDILNCDAFPWNYDWFVCNKHLSVEFLYDYYMQNMHTMCPRALFTHNTAYRFCKDPIYGPKYVQLLVDAVNNGSLILDHQLILSCSLSFPIAVLIQNPRLCNWAWICSRKDIVLPFDVIVKHPSVIQAKTWFMYNEIIKIPDDDDWIAHPWMQYIKLRFEKKLTIDVILANPDIPWVWEKLAECETLAINDLLSCAKISTIFMTHISGRPDLTIDVVIKHANLPWNWCVVYETLTRAS